MSTALDKKDIITSQGDKAFSDVAQGARNFAKSLEEVNEELIKAHKNLEKVTEEEVKGINATLKLEKARQESNKTVKDAIQNDIERVKLKQQINKLEVQELKEKERLEKEQVKLNKQREREAQQLKKNNNEYFKLAKRTRELKNEAKDLAAQMVMLEKSGKANTEEYAKLSSQYEKVAKQANEFDKNLKDIDKGLGDNFRNVGNYESALDGLGGAAGGVIQGFKGMSAAAKAFLANPIVLVITAIVGAVSALFKAFTSSKKGSELLGKAMAGLEGVMDLIVSIVDRLITGFEALFNDPVQAIKDFGKAIWDNIINRFLGVIELGKALGKSLKALWDMDLKKLKEAADDAGTALTQMVTGFDEAQQKAIVEGIKEETSRLNELADARIRLYEQQLRITRANRELTKQAAQLTTQEELQMAIADDMTKSFAEREKAAQRASELTIKRASLEKTVAENNLKQIRDELKLAESVGKEREELLNQELDAFVALEEAQKNYTLTVRDNQKRQSELVQDRLERDLDILLDGFDNQKSINERIIADTDRTFEERNAKLEETKQLFEESFREQINTIQEFTKIQIDENSLINESNAVVLNEKIRALGLSEIIEGRLLEIVRDRRTAIQDLAEAEKDLYNESVENQRKALEIKQKLRQAELQGEIEALEATQGAEDEAFKLKKQKLIEQAEFEMDNEELTAEEILLINQELENDLAELERQRLENQKKANKTADDERKKEIEAIKKAENEKIDTYKSTVEVLQDLNGRRVSQIDDVIEAINTEQALTAAKIEAGVDTYEDSLTKQNEARQKALADKRKLEKQQLLFEKTQAFLDTYRAILNSMENPDPTQAIIETLKAGATIQAASSSFIPSFDVGTDYVEGGNLDSQGGQLAKIHKGEGIFTKSEMDRFRSVGLDTREKITNAVFSNALRLDGNQDRSMNWMSGKEIINELKSMNKSLRNQPSHSVAYDNAAKTYASIEKSKYKTTINKYR